MGAISFTAHVSNKKSAITSKSKLAGVAKHNLRKYKSEEYSANNIFLIYGTDNLVQDVKAVYHQEFDEALKVYNENQTRADRRIPDYYEHVAKKEQDMAVELIVQIGDREYWKQNNGNKAYAKMIYRSILKELERLLPEFVVANAVVHMDEDSPHMHIVGVPVATGYKKGLSKQVSKRKVFTREVLSEVLQDKLREFANKEVELLFGEQIREKSKGRNHDLFVAEYKVAKETEHYEELRELTQSEQYKCNELERLADSKQERCDMLERLADSKQERCNYLERQAELQQNKYDKLQKEHEALASDYNRMLGKKVICEVRFEEAEQNVMKALELLQSYERMIEEKNNLLSKMEDEEQKLRQRVDKAEQLYDTFIGTGEDVALRERIIDVMYENDQLKAENSKLKATLEKAYDFMKQFVINGKNMLEKFFESIGQVVDRDRDGVRR